RRSPACAFLVQDSNMSLKTTAAPGVLLLVVASFAGPAYAHDDAPGAQDSVTLDTVIVTGERNREDPPVVADARAQLSRTPGSVAVVSSESYATRFAQGFSDSLRNV